MNFRLKKRLKGGGLSSVLRRFSEISSAYGFSDEKFAGKVEAYLSILRKHGVPASFAVTAACVPRNPKLFSMLCGEGFELLVQGFRHMEYSSKPAGVQEKDLRLAASVFKEYGLHFSGFRAPYLKYSGETRGLLSELFDYDSGEKFLWDVGLKISCRKTSSTSRSLPYLDGGLMEVPVSLPSDIWLVHRLGVKGREQILGAWRKTLDHSYRRGELFNLQLHPENIGVCGEALDALIGLALEKEPGVWVARLGDVAGWWRKRSGMSLELESGRGFKVECDLPENATVLVRGFKVGGAKPWFGGLERAEAKSFSVKGNPSIGVSPKASEGLKRFLSAEGFIVSESTDKNGFGIYFDAEDFSEAGKLRTLDFIESSGKPYVRLWRWPDGCRSAFCITGDIDCVTLWDYVYRALGK